MSDREVAPGLTGLTTRVGLVVLGGLPGSGKTTIATALARRTGAAHVRVDTIEQAVVDSGLAAHPVGVVGYVVAYAVAGDQLALGHPVVADGVNALEVTRTAWRAVARRHAVPVLEVEVVCTDAGLHEERATSRPTDVEGLVKPDWAQIQARRNDPWSPDLTVDTARTGVQEAVDRIIDAAPWWSGRPADLGHGTAVGGSSSGSW
ncbi:AAA family ATPase [Lapillicoccus sp.]|uniref:AAA family ATPase n=1 Tax=Lapillicoccus sp. TaxID=1909287 RepID=UPI0025E2AEDD|nr:AAA family ATPase [Lapillicoccus sp.]